MRAAPNASCQMKNVPESHLRRMVAAHAVDGSARLRIADAETGAAYATLNRIAPTTSRFEFLVLVACETWTRIVRRLEPRKTFRSDRCQNRMVSPAMVRSTRKPPPPKCSPIGFWMGSSQL